MRSRQVGKEANREIAVVRDKQTEKSGPVGRRGVKRDLNPADVELAWKPTDMQSGQGGRCINVQAVMQGSRWTGRALRPGCLAGHVQSLKQEARL